MLSDTSSIARLHYDDDGAQQPARPSRPDLVDLEDGLTRNVRKVEHQGTGDVEVTLTSLAEVNKAQPVFRHVYENA